MNFDPSSQLVRKLNELRMEHRDLDQAIDRLAADATLDEVQLKRLKKRKLRIRDQITFLESRMIPDLDA